MPKFAYVAVAPNGHQTKGIEKAESRAAAQPGGRVCPSLLTLVICC